jgi:hypothetical protein
MSSFIKAAKFFFNPYSILLLTLFFCTTLSMQYHTSQFSLGGFFLVSPLIGLAIFCSGKVTQLKGDSKNAITRENEFQRDVFLISYSFLIASLFALLPEYDNSDARAWWAISVYYVSLIGIIFSWFFASFNCFSRGHKSYTNIFSLIIIITFSLPKLWPLYVSVIFLGEVSFFWLMMLTLVFLHLLCFVLYTIIGSMRQE